ncbi:MAG TPA: family 20 glycosylhydrolase [archaeon]|nr:family 20 glycosylhydrolase [archaeon]
MITAQSYRVFIISALFLFCAILDSSASPVENQLTVLPQPAEFIPSGRSFTVSEDTRIVLCQGCEASDRFAVRELNIWLAELGYRPLEMTAAKLTRGTARGMILLGPPVEGGVVAGFLKEIGVKDAVPGSEKEGEYLIAANETAVVVSAGNAAGRFYGLMTLAQMFYRNDSLTILPGGVIHDYPALALRGISDDISRGQVSTPADMKEIVRFLARYKMNVYMPYLEDMFTFHSHPEFGNNRGALTRGDVAELEKFARSVHVRIIPIFQTLGHYENLLLKKNYRYLAEFPGAHTLSPSAEETCQFLRDVLGEIVPAFSDRYFHIGCDETWEVGLGKSRELVSKSGAGAVYLDHYRKIYDIVTGMDRRVMMYGDMVLNFPDLLSGLPKDIIIVDWQYSGDSYPSVAKFRKAGFDVVVSPSVQNFNRLYPDYGKALPNIENLTRVGFENGALGAITSSWCDNGAANFRQHNLWGYAFAADCAWNPRQRPDFKEAERIFWKNFFAVEDPEVFLEVNSLLASSLGRGFSLYDWWRNPLLQASRDGVIGVTGGSSMPGQKILRDTKRAAEILADAAPGVRANRWLLEILAYEADMGRCLGQKFIWQEEFVKAGKRNPPGPETGRREYYAAWAGSMASQLTGLKERFRAIWLKYNKPEGLDNNLHLFDRQIEIWTRIERALRSGTGLPEAEIQSEWITPAGSNAQGRQKEARSAFFRQKITLDGNSLPEKSILQLMGMTQAEIYLNGEPVGESLFSSFLMSVGENRRAGIIDLSGLLKPGDNFLAAKVTNYEGKVPSLNVYAELTKNGEVISRIITGTNWRGIETAVEPDGWMNVGFDDSAWKTCEKTFINLPVSAPMLRAGFNSRIEM